MVATAPVQGEPAQNVFAADTAIASAVRKPRHRRRRIQRDPSNRSGVRAPACGSPGFTDHRFEGSHKVRTADKPAAPPKPALPPAAKAAAAAPPTPAPGTGKPDAPGKAGVASGQPFSSLEHIFIFTTGEGRSVFQSQAVIRKLEEIVGEPAGTIREKVTVDVIGHANVGVEMMLNQAIPDKAWRAMFAIRPVIAQNARDELYHVCARPFTTENNDSAAALFFYTNRRYEPSSGSPSRRRGPFRCRALRHAFFGVGLDTLWIATNLLRPCRLRRRRHRLRVRRRSSCPRRKRVRPGAVAAG